MTRYATDFGAFEISPIPGQPQIAHCHSFFVVPEGRGKGMGTKQKLHQMELLDEELYDFATCTVDATNTVQKRVLAKTGWMRLAVFDNRRTAGQTELWGWAVGGQPAPQGPSTDIAKCRCGGTMAWWSLFSVERPSNRTAEVIFECHCGKQYSAFIPLPDGFPVPNEKEEKEGGAA